MAPPLSDAVVVDVLRRVDRLTTPLVRRLGRPPELPQAEREQWWADRVTRVAAVEAPAVEPAAVEAVGRRTVGEPVGVGHPGHPAEQRAEQQGRPDAQTARPAALPTASCAATTRRAGCCAA